MSKESKALHQDLLRSGDVGIAHMPDLEKQVIIQEKSQDANLSGWASTTPIAAWRFKASVEDWTNFFCVALNTAATVSIVFANKVIFSDPQLRHFQVGTAAWHFAATTLVLIMASMRPFNVFKPVKLPVKEVLSISILFVGFLVLGNLSLALNDVSFYQLAKIMTAPMVVLINFVLFKKHTSCQSLSAVLVSCVGVALPNMALIGSNPIGALVAVAAFVTTAFYQIWIGKKVEELNVSAPQLLLNQAPVAVLLLCLLLPFTDTVPDFRQIQPEILATFFLSGILAAGLNLSQFLIIGRTSAVTFNVVSNAKNVIIIVLGWYTAHHNPSLMDLAGVFLALTGAAAYSWLRR
ncbi:hypothetical protein B0A52_02160 [Exophiala mesophila]|uniref:Sugar phosphate transporter domain-containing protein n=1 Tax=Exophiala mesophila TaxID=212818 RepID=A0A438NB79_EXOME|nr:hypothetical protein B0A52_02160 [Exophiala mesophila]